MEGDTIHRCTLCGDFHLSTMDECDDCMRSVVAMRSHIEERGGRLTVIDGRIVVHTRVQMSDPIEMLAHGVMVRRVLGQIAANENGRRARKDV